jgi:hypothetical protein
MAGAVEPCERRTGFLLGRLVADDAHDCALGDPRGRQADDGPPALPAWGGEGATEAHRAACTGLDGGRPSAPPRGRDGVTVRGQGPTTGQGREGGPRRAGKEALQEGHDQGAKGCVPQGVHGNSLQKERLSCQMTYLPGVEVAGALA